ncbi:hypothetical protein [Bacteroides pyogenes]|uniref:hypothetical protein n=1 Tax=Bacteroides pyogenes TaxID=310300 RepID=UPI001F29EFAD|nr:hypothetical protein [Bacteroides pyogenes]MCE9107516.1 hypothetical protein [Bacteroides pyogenes]MDY5353352.1 hypothetical protein [Bacteroides pyogenes]
MPEESCKRALFARPQRLVPFLTQSNPYAMTACSGQNKALKHAKQRFRLSEREALFMQKKAFAQGKQKLRSSSPKNLFRSKSEDGTGNRALLQAR